MIRRVLSILKSWIKALFAPAKDPREGPPSGRRRQADLLARVRDARVRIEATRTTLQREMESCRGETARLRDEARRLLHDDREDVARIVLRRRQAVVEHVRFLEEQASHVEREAQTLASVEYMLRTEVAASAAHKDVAEARLRAAEARARVGEALSGISDDLFSDSEGLQSADERTEYMLARADAIDELVALGVLPSSATWPVRGFQSGDGDSDDDVEAELKELKCGMCE